MTPTRLLTLTPLLLVLAACAPALSSQGVSSQGASSQGAATAPAVSSAPNTSSTSSAAAGVNGAGPAPLTAPASRVPEQYTLRAINTGLSSNTLQGTATLAQVGTTATTTLRLSGLQPATNYIAVYRVPGNIPSVPPCSQPGDAVPGTSFSGMSDSTGTLLLTGTAPNSTLIPAVTLTVSTADLAGDQAIDGGILCTTVTTLNR